MTEQTLDPIEERLRSAVDELSATAEFMFTSCKDQIALDIDTALEESQMSKTDLAKAIDHSRQYVHEFLSDEYNPTIKSLAEIAEGAHRRLVTRIVDFDTAIVLVPLVKLPAVRDYVHYNIPMTIQTAQPQLQPATNPSKPDPFLPAKKQGQNFGAKPQKKISAGLKKPMRRGDSAVPPVIVFQ